MSSRPCPRAAVVVEDRYSQIFTLERVRPAQVADSLAELQVRWPTIAMVFCESRKLAEEWTYRYLAAAHTWAANELPALARIGTGEHEAAGAPPRPAPSTGEVREWARANGLIVPDRGRLRLEVHQAWQDAQVGQGLALDRRDRLGTEADGVVPQGRPRRTVRTRWPAKVYG